MADSLSLNVASFNCRGYNDSKRNYIRSLLSTVPVLFLQETWLSDGQLFLSLGVSIIISCLQAVPVLTTLTYWWAGPTVAWPSYGGLTCRSPYRT